MAKIARNSPCPCGSGRKYKQCCLLEEERLAKHAREDSRVGKLISDWSVEQFGDELARAFEEFHPESHRIGERDVALLLSWFISDRELPGGGTPLERYLAGPELDAEEREVAERIAAARLGIHRVKSVVSGCSLELEDVLTGAVIPVASQTVSREVVLWDVVLCRVMPGGPAATLWGPVLVYAPDEEPELRAELARLAAACGLSLDPAGFSEAFRVACRELLRFVPPSRLAEPSYFTAEGDQTVSARAAWSLLDPDDAFIVLDESPELLWDRPERRRAVGPAEKDMLTVGYLEQYLRRWLDEPLQQLDGATPRAAANIPKFRADLQLLVRAIENRAEHARRAGAAWPDVAWLWDELELSVQLAA